MIRNILLFACQLSAFALSAAERPLKSSITSVTVYLSGAQVTRTAQASLPEGPHTLVIENLPAKLNAQSIQVEGPDGLTLEGVSHQIDYLNKQRVSEQTQQLNIRAESLQLNIQQLQARLSVYEHEETLLLTNQSLGGKDQAVTAAQLRETADLFRQRLQEIKLKQLDLQQQIREGQKQLADLRKTQQDVLSKEDVPTSKIIIKLMAKQAVSGKMLISYMVDGAGWFPAYDIRVEEVGKPLLLQYKARVFQQTGEDWQGVKLSLSTGNPEHDNSQPVLEGIKVNFNELVRYQSKQTGPVTRVSGQVRDGANQPLPGVTVRIAGTSMGTVTAMDGSYSLSLPRQHQLLVFSFIGYETQEVAVTSSSLNITLMEDVQQLSEVVVTARGFESALQAKVAGVQVDGDRRREKKSSISAIAAPEVVQQQNAVTTEFSIKTPYTIISNGRQQTVEIAQHQVPAFYRYYTAPVINENAFLTAGFTGWEGYDLLEGEANLFFEGKFVGETLLDPNLTNDTLNFSLGRDRNVVVERKMMKDFQEKNFFGSKRKETNGYEILVRNAREQAVEVVVEDRYPVSANEAIVMKVEEKSGAQQNESTGLLRWQIKLNPRESKTLQLRYTLEYPKDKKVTVY